MSARSRQRKNQSNEQPCEAVKHKLNFNLRRIEPLTKNQERVFKHRDQHQLLYGVAGTGKTFLALAHALEDTVEHNLYRKIIIIRSCVSSRDIGHLPGNEKDKAAVYEQPYQEICTELFNRSDAYEILKQKKIIEFHSTSFIRGLTFSNCVVILDEFQNLDRREAESVLTRIGEGTRVLICGDCRQDDLLRKREKTGARDIMKIVESMGCFNFVEFDIEDIVRSGFVKQWIIAATELESKGKIDSI